MLFGPHELILLDPRSVPKPTNTTAILNRPVNSTLSPGMIQWAEKNPDRIVQGPKTDEIVDPDSEDSQNHVHTWTSILAMTFNLEATDPRDKIFALRGLVTAHESMHIAVVYSCDMADPYASVGRHFIVGNGIDKGDHRRTRYRASTTSVRCYATTSDGLGYNKKSLRDLESDLASETMRDAVHRITSLDLPSWCSDFWIKTKAALVDYLTFSASGTT